MSLANGRVEVSSVDANWTVTPQTANAQAQQDAELANADPNALIQGDPAQPEENAGEPVAPALSEIEQIAAEMGWRPQAEWQGDPNRWTPAKDYILTTRKLLDERQSQLKTARQQQRQAEQTYARELSQRMAALERDLSAKTQAQLDAQARRIHQEYENLKFKAAQEGDEKTYQALTAEQAQELGKIDAERAKAQPQAQPQVDYNAIADNIMNNPASLPERKFITERHSWLLSDDPDAEEAFEAAINAMNEAAEQGAPKVQQLQYAENTLRFLYPERFERRAPANPDRNAQATEAQERAARAAAQPRADDGKWTQAQQQQRRPAPAVQAANRAASLAASEPDVVTRAKAQAPAAMAEWAARNKAGTTKLTEQQWAEISLGERTNVL